MRPRYLWQHSESRNWYYRYRFPKDVADARNMTTLHKVSLGTPDLAKAMVKMTELLRTDLLIVMAVRQNLSGKWEDHVVDQLAQAPGQIVDHPDGSWSVVSGNDIVTYDADRREIGRRPNEMMKVVTLDKGNLKQAFDVLEKINPSRGKSFEDQVFDYWAEGRGFANDPKKKYMLGDAKKTIAEFKEISGKTFTTADRDDTTELANHYFEQGLKYGSILRKVGYLRAMFNFAKENPRKFPALKKIEHPFPEKAVPYRDDETDRKILDDEDMLRVYCDLPNWHPEERLVWAVCATTGMRRGEVWNIDSEERITGDDGVMRRVVHVGTKTPSSDRRLPLTQELIDYLGDELPSRIEGPLLSREPHDVGRNILRRLRQLGITDEGKVLHSLRHRASTRMDAGVSDSLRDAILGHGHSGKRGAVRSAPKRYFHGHKMSDVIAAMNKIGLGAPSRSHPSKEAQSCRDVEGEVA